MAVPRAVADPNVLVAAVAQVVADPPPLDNAVSADPDDEYLIALALTQAPACGHSTPSASLLLRSDETIRLDPNRPKTLCTPIVDEDGERYLDTCRSI